MHSGIRRSVSATGRALTALPEQDEAETCTTHTCTLCSSVSLARNRSCSSRLAHCAADGAVSAAPPTASFEDTSPGRRHHRRTFSEPVQLSDLAIDARRAAFPAGASQPRSPGASSKQRGHHFVFEAYLALARLAHRACRCAQGRALALIELVRSRSRLVIAGLCVMGALAFALAHHAVSYTHLTLPTTPYV